MSANRSLSDRVHDQILEQIIRNPNTEEMMFNEKSVAEQFGVSKAPAREALIRLCGEGVLKNVPRMGYFVIHMSEQDIRNVMQVRVLLETEALRKTGRNFRDAMQKELQEQIGRAVDRKNNDVWDVWDNNEEFHMLLASFSGDNIILRFLKECMGIQKRAFIQNRWDLLNTMTDSMDVSSHMQILQALADRDFAAAEEILKKDIMWQKF